MQRLSEFDSPDGELTFIVAKGEDGEMFVTFKGSSWHAHPDGVSAWLGVPESEALTKLALQLTNDCVPIIVSTDAGVTIDPWLSDNLEATIDLFGVENCVIRYWSGATISPGAKP